MPITKAETQPDGSVIVSGMCTSDTIDLDDQIIDLDFSRKGLAEWGSTWGNIRQMHSTNLPPAGVAVAVDTTRPEGVHLTARIVEPGAVKLVNEGVYKAFSVGISRPRIVRDMVAKNGRVTDGVFSEVSLVDFPALPSATFTVAKRSSVEVTKIEKAMTRFGITKFADSAVIDVADVPAEDFAGPDQTFAIVTPEDVHDAAALIHHADEPDAVKAQIKSIAQRKGQTFVEQLPEEWIDADIAKSASSRELTGGATDDLEKKKKNRSSDDVEDAADAADAEAVPTDNSANDGSSNDDDDDDDDDSVNKTLESVNYALRRAHDVTCSAFTLPVVTNAHPAIATKGISSVLDPEIVRTALVTIGQDSSDAHALVSLAKAYGDATMLSMLEPETLIEAREEMNKSFTDAYPNANPTPTNVTPGQFQRGFLAAGHAPLSSNGSSPNIPMANTTIQADDFGRGPLTDGEQSSPPANMGNRPPASISAVDQISAAARDQASAAMSALHDHISAIYPNICPIGNGPAAAAGISTAGVDTLPMDGSITSIAAAATPTLTKSEKKAEKLEKRAKKIEKQALKLEKSGAVASAIVSENGEVLIDTAVLTDIVQNILAGQPNDRIEALEKRLSEAQAELDRINSEPDPAAAPIRGSVAVERATAITKSATPADIVKSAADQKLREEIAYLEKIEKSGNPELRMRAQQRLEVLLERSAFTDAE